MPLDLVNLVNAAYLLLFITLISASAIRMAYRVLEYRRAGQKVPSVLKRDVFFFTGLSVPFIGILLFRVLGITAFTSTHPLWVIPSGLFAVAAAAYWFYFEIKRIEK